MKKLYLGVIALYIGILSAHAQTPEAATDTSNYRSRKLTLEEVNFVSGYYRQTGDNSAVTGGQGTERLSDIATTFDVQLSKFNPRGKKNAFSFELGVDHYTSASSDKIDPNTISSASSRDTRIYPSLNWTQSNEKSGLSFGFTGSYSHEYDYQSFGTGFNLSKISKDQNTQFDLKFSAFIDKWSVIFPVELRTSAEARELGGSQPRNSFNTVLSLSQVVNPRLQALIVLEPSYQNGLLATKYQRSYFTDGSVKAENLPDTRYKLPIGIRLNYFIDDRFIVRSFYRYYMDSWGIRAHTAELEVPAKITSFISLSPFFRYNKQTGIRYFQPYGMHNRSETYFTSDYDLSELNSNFIGLNLRLSPPEGVLGWQRLSSFELRLGHYVRSTGLKSNIVTMAMKFK